MFQIILPAFQGCMKLSHFLFPPPPPSFDFVSREALSRILKSTIFFPIKQQNSVIEVFLISLYDLELPKVMFSPFFSLSLFSPPLISFPISKPFYWHKFDILHHLTRALGTDKRTYPQLDPRMDGRTNKAVYWVATRH